MKEKWTDFPYWTLSDRYVFGKGKNGKFDFLDKTNDVIEVEVEVLKDERVFD